MPLITRQDKGSKLTIPEMDGNLTYLSQNKELESDGISYSVNLSNEGIKLIADEGTTGGEVISLTIETPEWLTPPVPGTYEVSPTGGSGTDLLLSIIVEQDVELTLVLNEILNGGSGYAGGDKLNINTTQLGSEDPFGQDFTITLGKEDVSVANIQSLEILNSQGAVTIFMPNLPISDPEISGALWNNNGLLNRSMGAIPAGDGLN